MRYYLIPLSLLLLWEAFTWYNPINKFLFPAPTAIIQELYTRHDLFWEHLQKTLTIMLLGGACAFLVAFPLGYLMMRFKRLQTILEPLFVTTQCIPIFALAPLMVLWFGWTMTATVIPTALMVFFPMTLSIYRGLTAAPQDFVDYFRANQATELQLFWKLRLPWALPEIFSGLRISAAVAGIGAVAGEWAGAQQGLGVLILESRRNADLPTCFAALFCLTAVTLGLYGTIAWVEKRWNLFRKLASRGLAIALLALVTCSCSNTKEEPLRLSLDWLPNPNHVPLYVGLEKGFFREEGVEFVIQKAEDPGNPLPLVEGGMLDLTISYMPYFAKAVNKGADLRTIGILIEKPLNSIIYRTDRGIKGLEDLNGKSFAYSTGESTEKSFNARMKLRGITPGAQHRVGFDLITTLATGQVDAVYEVYYTIELPQLEAMGVPVRAIVLTEFGSPEHYELIFVASNHSKRFQDKEADAFRRAVQRSINWCRAHPQEAFEIYAKANPIKSKETLQWERRSWELTLPVLATSQRQDPAVWQQFLAWQQKIGALPEGAPPPLKLQ